MNPISRPGRRSLMRRAFTLVELLTVLAITAILLTIILVPMFQGFNFTRAAQGYADAQDKARGLSERISREIGNAAAVRDPNGIGGTVYVRLPLPATGEVEGVGKIDPVPGAGTTIALPLQFSKLDLIPPAEGDPDLNGAGLKDPDTGKIDPTLAAPKGQITLPLAAGTRLVRYWVGLRDPFRPYNNPYDGLLMQRSGGRDNLYVLYRAEVVPVRRDPGSAAAPTVGVNTAFFKIDPNGDGRTPLYDDPGTYSAATRDVTDSFFVPNRRADGTIVDNDAHADRIRNWLRRAVVQTEISRYDLISAEYNQSTRLVRLFPNPDNTAQYAPRLLPLVQFRPDRVANDPAEGQTAARLGEEADGAQGLGPETFKTKFGAWSGALVRLYPTDWDRTGSTPLYETGKLFTDGATSTQRYGIFAQDATQSVEDSSGTSGVLLFDSTQYLQAQNQGRVYPFSEAVNRANTLSGWLGNATLRPLFNPFTIDAERGLVRTSFGIEEIGLTNGNGQSEGDVNNDGRVDALDRLLQLPSTPANSYGAPNADASYTPANDPVAAVGTGDTFDNAKYGSVNARFNKLWTDALGARNGVPAVLAERGIAQRFIDLRVTPTGDNIASPLDPRQGFTRTRIVPGSEVVFGPDMTPGSNYGFEIRYRRTTREVPGPNEYRINYVDLPEPGESIDPSTGRPAVDGSGQKIVNYAPAFGTANPPAAYDATNLVSAVLQPRYKAGYLVLCSEPNVPIPAQTIILNPTTQAYEPPVSTRIRVSYRFQMVASNDVVAVDYDTRSLISVLLTIRNHAQTNLPNPPSVSLKATATARNILR